MSMKPRLDDNNVGIPNTASQPKKTDESYYEIPNTATCMHPATNSKLDPKLVTGPKTHGN
jgi:hypothetical protein